MRSIADLVVGAAELWCGTVHSGQRTADSAVARAQRMCRDGAPGRKAAGRRDPRGDPGSRQPFYIIHTDMHIFNNNIL